MNALMKIKEHLTAVRNTKPFLKRSRVPMQACLIGMMLVASESSFAQLAAGKDKFLGNIIGTSVPNDWNTYWNQVTPENGGKWDALEPNAPSGNNHTYNWTVFDTALNQAKNRGIPFRHHTFLWGNQAPSWLVQYNPGSTATNWSNSLKQGITGAQAVEHLKSLMSAVCQRGAKLSEGGTVIGTYLDIVDVVNEALPSHQTGTNNDNGKYSPWTWPVVFKDALGGSGTTGYDWVAEAFMLARERCPYSKLAINDYGVINSSTDTNTYIDIVKSVISLEKTYRDKGRLLAGQTLIDAVELQSHYFSLGSIAASEITDRLNLIANSTGLPLYISEFDLDGTETAQADRYKVVFPAMWENCNVRGMTLWGYIEGQTWHAGTGLINANGTKKASMTWLQSYMSSVGTPTCPTKPLGSNIDTGGRADQSNGNKTLHWDAPTPVSIDACPNGQSAVNVTWTIAFATLRPPAPPSITGPMTYNSVTGRYEGTIPPVNPNHDNATITFSRTCNGIPVTEVVNVYVDPSGTVKTVEGAPVIGAIVTLLRSDNGINGTYYAPTSESGVMSPRNTTNPDKTRGYGAFGWDVQGGYYYKVRAENPLCVSPTNPSQKFVETAPMFIPPEVTGLDIRLNCPKNGALVQVSKTSDWGSGYCANVTVTNITPSVLDWDAVFTAEGTIYDFWNATYTQSGTSVTASGVTWNNTLAPGESTNNVGFCATRTANTGSYPIRVRARGTSGQESINLTVGGTVIATWRLSTAFQDYSVNTSLGGGINVVYTNDAPNRDVVVDYVAINNVVNQAEDQTQNTAVFANGVCGGGSHSEWMHCNGYIGFSAFK
jgi:GH35 family endo-1,4-beta-xylanase